MIADPESRWVSSTVVPSSISRIVSGRASTAALVRASPESMIAWRSRPLPANAAPSSSMTTVRSRLSTDSTSRLRLSNSVSVCTGVAVFATVMWPPFGEVRAAAPARLQVDVLLPHRGAVRHDGAGVRGDPAPAVEAQVDVDAVVGQPEPVDATDGDARDRSPRRW